LSFSFVFVSQPLACTHFALSLHFCIIAFAHLFRFLHCLSQYGITCLLHSKIRLFRRSSSHKALSRDRSFRLVFRLSHSDAQETLVVSPRSDLVAIAKASDFSLSLPELTSRSFHFPLLVTPNLPRRMRESDELTRISRI